MARIQNHVVNYANWNNVLLIRSVSKYTEEAKLTSLNSKIIFENLFKLKHLLNLIILSCPLGHIEMFVVSPPIINVISSAWLGYTRIEAAVKNIM